MSPQHRRPKQDANAYRTLGKALKELREHAQLTQEELAAKMDIGSTYISQVENGHRGIRWHTLLNLLHALDGDLRQLADAVDQQERSASLP